MTPQVHEAKAKYETVVPSPFNPPVRDMAKEWCQDVCDTLTGWDDCYDARVSEVENESRSGFIPFTDGGYDGVGYATLRSAYSSGSVPKAIQPYLDRELKDIEEAWDSEHPKHTYAWIFEESDPEADEGQAALFGPSRERDHWREKYWDFENEYMSEGGTYFYKVRALFYDSDSSSNETGEPEILFCVGINTDFEYGRDHIAWLSAYGSDPQCTKWLWERTVKAKDLTPELRDELIKQATDALASA